MNPIAQETRYKQSLLQYAKKYGVGKVSKKYNRARSFIYFWLKRWDGTEKSLCCQSRRPHHHPNEHTPEELKLIRDMKRRNPALGMVELWCRLRERGYTRRIESLYRVLKREGLIKETKKMKYKPKPYEQMTHPGERIQIDVKVVPRCCIADKYLRLFQYTAIDEYSRFRVLGAYPEQSIYSTYLFALKVVEEFTKHRVEVKCIQTDNGMEFTNRFNPSSKGKLTLFESVMQQLHICHKLVRPYTPRHNGKVERSHREDQKCFCNTHSFYSLAKEENRISMRPLNRSSHNGFLASFTV